jgi:hypothetical protein
MFSRLVGGTFKLAYQAEQRETLTAALLSLQSGYPTGILEPLARPVGNPRWVTRDKRIAREQAYVPPRHSDPLLV